MKILMNYFELEGTASYPDAAEYFSNLQVVNIGDTKLYTCEYTGKKDLVSTKYTLADLAEWNNLVNACAKEREWRDTEMSRTDLLVLLPDYPRDGTDLLAYRQALADYPKLKGFPYGARPVQEEFKAK